MTGTRTDAVIRTYGPDPVGLLLDTLADIWSEAHPELGGAPGASTDGLSAAALRRQIAGHTRHEGFTLVAAYTDAVMVGFGYAFPCTPAYWFGDLLPEIPEHVHGGRLMGICELAVVPTRQSQGIGSLLHAALVTAIDPQWSSLLVRPDNRNGRRLYERLGYTYAGPYRNEPDGPFFDLLLSQIDHRG